MPLDGLRPRSCARSPWRTASPSPPSTACSARLTGRRWRSPSELRPGSPDSVAELAAWSTRRRGGVGSLPHVERRRGGPGDDARTARGGAARHRRARDYKSSPTVRSPNRSPTVSPSTPWSPTRCAPRCATRSVGGGGDPSRGGGPRVRTGARRSVLVVGRPPTSRRRPRGAVGLLRPTSAAGTASTRSVTATSSTSGRCSTRSASTSGGTRRRCSSGSTRSSWDRPRPRWWRRWLLRGRLPGQRSARSRDRRTPRSLAAVRPSGAEDRRARSSLARRST